MTNFKPTYLLIFIFLQSYAICQNNDVLLNSLFEKYTPPVPSSSVTLRFSQLQDNVVELYSNGFSLKTNLSQNEFIENLVLGIAKNVETRSREEIATAFFEKFGKYLNSKEFNIYKALFQRTNSQIEVIINDIYNYKNHIQSLQGNFQLDIKEIPKNFIYVIDSLKLSETHQDILYIASISANSIINKTNLFDFSKELITNLKDKNLVSYDGYKVITIIYEYLDQEKSISLKDLENILNKYYPNNSENFKYSNQIFNELSNIRYLLENIDSTNNKLLLINSAYKIIELLPDKNANFKTTISIAKNLGSAFALIRQNKLESGILEIISVFETVLKSNCASIKIEIASFKSKMSNDDSDKKEKKKLENQKCELDKKCINIKKPLLYLNFIAQIAKAKDGNEIADIIKRTSLGVGSYRQKRNSIFTSYINAYAGGQYSYKGKNSKFMQNYNIYGLSAPVGISLSWRRWGGFVSIIDVGSYLGYTEDKSGQLKDFPDVTLANIFAPGAFLEVNNLFNTFLSVSAGYNFGPWNLSKTNNIENISSKGLQANLKIDLPLYLLTKK